MNTATDLAQPQLFLDDQWISFSHNAHRAWHQARKYPQPVIVADQQWEYGRLQPCAYGTILDREGRFRAWYMANGRVGYAESDDGVHWDKPQLGLHELHGNSRNNVVLVEGKYIDDISVIETPDDTSWPLKALYWANDTADGKPGIFLARSKNGIHWDKQGKVLNWGDRFNAVARQVNGKFLLFGRDDVTYPGAKKGRVVVRSESDDLIHWTAAELILQTDLDDPVCMQSYSLTVFPYADVLIGGFERMYFSPDKLDVEIVWSRDAGRTWRRSIHRPRFIEWGHSPSWDSHWIALPSNAPIRRGNRLYFFYSGRYTTHSDIDPQGLAAIGVATLRVDGFCSLHSASKTGAVVTHPMTWPGGDLLLNFDARHDLEAHPSQTASGMLKVEVRDENNQPIPGFAADDFPPQCINTANLADCHMAATWNNGKTLKELVGRNIRFLFVLRDCHLYSFKSGTIQSP